MRISLAALFVTTSVVSAFAAELPKEGNYDYVSCWTGVNNTINLSKTYTASSYELTGSSRSTTPGRMFDKNTFRCGVWSRTLTART